MAQVLGVGGVFFKAEQPTELAKWYKKHLGLEIESTFGGCSFHPQQLPAGSRCIWAPFPADTNYFLPSTQSYMINLIVDNLEQALQQVSDGGAELYGQSDEAYGRFGWFSDPEGNKVELWQVIQE